jgi:hypothetical protein
VQQTFSRFFKDLFVDLAVAIECVLVPLATDGSATIPTKIQKSASDFENLFENLLIHTGVKQFFRRVQYEIL